MVVTWQERLNQNRFACQYALNITLSCTLNKQTHLRQAWFNHFSAFFWRNHGGVLIPSARLVEFLCAMYTVYLISLEGHSFLLPKPKVTFINIGLWWYYDAIIRLNYISKHTLRFFHNISFFANSLCQCSLSADPKCALRNSGTRYLECSFFLI